jgi:hypothetical protein
MSSRLLLTILPVLLLLPACSRTPSRIIPEGKMEYLLADIHLAEAIMDNNYNAFSDSAGQAQLFQSIFEKHKVTKARFDTSLVWYASHLEIYMEIYRKTSSRLAAMSDTLANRIRFLHEQEAQAKCVWEADSLIVLNPFPSDNRYVFQVDTSMFFSRGDMYALHVFALGVNGENRPKVTFAWKGQDTTLVDRTEIRCNGTNIFYLKAIPGKDTKSLYGSIRLPMDELPPSRLILDNIFILRHREGYHPEIKIPEETQTTLASDSLSSGSTPADSTNILR